MKVFRSSLVFSVNCKNKIVYRAEKKVARVSKEVQVHKRMRRGLIFHGKIKILAVSSALVINNGSTVLQ